MMPPIWKLETDDAEKELELELAYRRALTTQQPFEMMFRKSREMAEMLQQHRYRKPVEIVNAYLNPSKEMNHETD